MAKGEYLGEFEQIVLLALLRLGEQAYGMLVRKEIADQTGRDVSIGAVYATLDRLEQKGHVSSHQGAPTAQRGGRAKRYFSIKGSGARALRSSNQFTKEMWKGLEEILGTR